MARLQQLLSPDVSLFPGKLPEVSVIAHSHFQFVVWDNDVMKGLWLAHTRHNMLRPVP